MARGEHIGAAQGVDAAICQKRTEPQSGRRGGLYEGVPYHKTVGSVQPQQLLAYLNAAHAVGYRRGGGVIECGDIFVPFRLVRPRKLVKRQVEALLVLNHRLVHTREQHVALRGALLYGADHKTVIFARVATRYSRIHISAGAVGRQKFAFERILQIDKVALVEFQD